MNELIVYSWENNGKIFLRSRSNHLSKKRSVYASCIWRNTQITNINRRRNRKRARKMQLIHKSLVQQIASLTIRKALMGRGWKLRNGRFLRMNQLRTLSVFFISNLLTSRLANYILLMQKICYLSIYKHEMILFAYCS